MDWVLNHVAVYGAINRNVAQRCGLAKTCLWGPEVAGLRHGRRAKPRANAGMVGNELVKRCDEECI